MFSAVLIYVSVYRSSQGPWDRPYPPAAPTCSWYQPRPRETRCRLSARLPLDLNAERLLVLATARELLLCNTSLCLSPFFHHPRSNNSFSNVATCALRFLPVFSLGHMLQSHLQGGQFQEEKVLFSFPVAENISEAGRRAPAGEGEGLCHAEPRLGPSAPHPSLPRSTTWWKQ